MQEVLLILEECWNSSPELHNVPIYQASGLARRAISVYQTYIEMMNDDIKAAFQVSPTLQEIASVEQEQECTRDCVCKSDSCFTFPS